MEKKQTAVEWYANASHELIVKKNNGEITNTDFLIMHHNLFYEAQKMEKEQIEEAYNDGAEEIHDNPDYYNETYGETKKQITMEREFVPYELALELKQLGFDEMCIGAYFHPNLSEMKYPQYFYSNTGLMMGEDACTAPLYQQAFRWFREKHNIDAWVQPFVSEKQNGKPFLPDESYVYYIFKDGVYVDDAVNFLNYEEAELACLQKLIEIVKTK